MSIKSIQGRFLLLGAVVLGISLILGGFWLSRINKSGKALRALIPVQQASPGDSLKTARSSYPTPAEAIASVQYENTLLERSIISYLVLVFVLIGGGAFWIRRSFVRALKNPLYVLDNLVQGNASIQATETKDEFAPLVKAANQLSGNINRSSSFAQSIGEGNFDFDFKPVSEYDTLGNALVQMREKLKSIAEADKKRNWTTEGLARFADFLRKSDDQQALSDILIRELVKYTRSNQGGLFILNRDDEKDPYLELIACYAYERKKFITKRIDVGAGLVGQVFLEGESVYLTEVPEDYVTITSGLGQATPTSILVIPLKLNEVTEGVIELASFRPFEPHEIEFVQRVGEIIASAISTSRITERTKKMLEASQQQAEEMRSQEEEMRQNMEEMQATQEAMHRQAEEMKKIQVNLELEKSMFNVLMEFLPDRITYKDTESRILRVNKAKAQRMNLAPEELVGKTDYDFFAKDHAEKAMREEKALIDSAKPLLDIEERLVYNNGDTAWVSTSRIPFKNEHNRVTGMFIITKDITKLKAAELSVQDRDAVFQRLLKDIPLFHYKVNREGQIFEAWKGNAAIPDVSLLNSRFLKEIFPNVDACVRDKSTSLENKSCKESSQLIPGTFRHYVFNDSLHADSCWVFALLEPLRN